MKNTLVIVLFSMLLSNCSQTKPMAARPPSIDVENGKPQSLNLSAVRTLPGVYIQMEVDMLGNLYLLTPTNQLKKLNAEGDSTGVFNDIKRYGNPTMIDVSNPLRTLVYYKPYTTVLLLDRFLTQRATLNLRNQNILLAKAVTSSYDNNIWVYDEGNARLKKMDESGNLLSESSDLRQVLNTSPNVSAMLDHNNAVYLYDVQKGIYVFDYYGAFKNLLPVTRWTNLHIANNNVYGFLNGSLQVYNSATLHTNRYDLPPELKAATDIKFAGGRLYALYENAIRIFEVK